jgi:hypothetical protein
MPSSMFLDMIYYVFHFAFENVTLMAIAIFIILAILMHRLKIPLAAALPVMFVAMYGFSLTFGQQFQAVYWLTAFAGAGLLGYAIVRVLWKR